MGTQQTTGYTDQYTGVYRACACLGQVKTSQLTRFGRVIHNFEHHHTLTRRLVDFTRRAIKMGLHSQKPCFLQPLNEINVFKRFSVSLILSLLCGISQ